MDRTFDLVLGLHGITHALENPKRSNHILKCTDDGLKSLKSKVKSFDKIDKSIKMFTQHDLQEEAKKDFKTLDYEFQRITSGIYLLTSPYDVPDSFNWLFNNSDKLNKVICLDQVTDIHNAAAIVRTASFFGVDTIIISSKQTFSLSPSFYRLACGGVEHLTILKSNNLSKTITSLNEKNFMTLALSEHSTIDTLSQSPEKKIALILGAEDLGISNAVLRVCSHEFALKSKGEIRSLNVSVAAALAMNKFF